MKHSTLPRMYAIQENHLLPSVRSSVRVLFDDNTATHFMRSCAAVTWKTLRGFAHDVATIVLGVYRADALFNAPHVHLLSTPQWKYLLQSNTLGVVLDVGAGMGLVSSTLEPLATSYRAIETSPYLFALLQEKGFDTVLGNICDEDVARKVGMVDTVILCNVLDRTPAPHTLIRAAMSLVNTGGTLIISIPLPVYGYVFQGSRAVSQIETISQSPGESWEVSVNQFYTALIKPYGLSVVSLSRAPYIVQQFDRRGYCIHDNVIFVLKK